MDWDVIWHSITDWFELKGLRLMIIKARIKVQPIRQWRIKREFNRRLKKAFDERGIEIPFPHLTVYPGQDKTGHAPPLRVTMQQPETDA